LQRGVDETLVDGAGRVAAESARGAGGILRKIQSGNIRSYAGWIAAGAAALLLMMVFGHQLLGAR
jgi:NADH-quinone oxidoreductase subunit L